MPKRRPDSPLHVTYAPEEMLPERPESAPEDDFGDLDSAVEGVDLLWYVYRPFLPGEALPPGVNPRTFGQFAYKFAGRPDLAEIAARVGPGTWRLVCKRNGALAYNRFHVIAGEPWPLSRLNPPPPELPPAPPPTSPPAPEPARLPAAYPTEPARASRGELVEAVRQALGELGIRGAPSYYGAPPAAPPPETPLQTLMQAFNLAREFTKPTTPIDTGGFLSAIVNAFQSGMDLGRQANPENPGPDPLAALAQSILPLVGKAIENAPARRPPAPAPAPPERPRPVAVAPSVAPVPSGAAPGISGRQAAVVEMLALGIERQEDPERVADAIELLLGDADLTLLARASVADVRAWLGSAQYTYPALSSLVADRWLESLLGCFREPPIDVSAEPPAPHAQEPT